MRGGANIKAKLALNKKRSEKENKDKQSDVSRMNLTTHMTEGELLAETVSVSHFWRGECSHRRKLL